MTAYQEPIPSIDLVVIGAQKSGTSSLMTYLSQHPQIATHRSNEIGFFVNDEIYQQGYEWTYQSHFAHNKIPSAERRIICAKNVWIMTQETALLRLQKHNPKAQLVVILRNPIDRAYSSFWYARRSGWEDKKDFESAIFADPQRLENNISRYLNCQYLEAGKYVVFLDLIQRYFSSDQLHVYLFEELKTDPNRICQEIFGLFPGLSNFEPDVSNVRNKAARSRSQLISQAMNQRGKYKQLKQLVKFVAPSSVIAKGRAALKSWNEVQFTPPPMEPQLRARLASYFQPYNEALGRYLKKDLSNWL